MRAVYPLHFWTEEENEFMRQNQKGLPIKEVKKLFEEHFGCTVSDNSFAQHWHKLKLHNGLAGGQFKKGITPWNKGKKMDHNSAQYKAMVPTMFKKGQKPKNTHPKGTRVLWSDKRDGLSYWAEKVSDEGNHLTGAWKLCHHIIWEQANGPIPEGCVIIFLDGDRNNLELSNLRCITRRAHRILNRHYYDNWDDADERNITIDLLQLDLKLKDKMESLNI